MRSQHSLEEIAELYGLLENIKREYETGIHSVLRKSNPELFSNPHTIPKLKKISINRGLGLAAQNTNILKKSITGSNKRSTVMSVVMSAVARPLLLHAN